MLTHTTPFLLCHKLTQFSCFLNMRNSLTSGQLTSRQGDQTLRCACFFMFCLCVRPISITFVASFEFLEPALT